MLRALIFDFNGIIVDDEPIHFELFKQVLAEEGIKLTEADYYARYLGFDDRGAFTAAYREHGRSLDEKLLARLIDRKTIYYQSEIRSKVRIFPGVEKLVTTLVPVLPLAVASGALRQEIETILSAAGLLKHFAVIISAEDVDHGKPEPEIFLKALARLNAQVEDGHPIDAADCLVIEDSKEGIRGARRAGMKCLAVSNSHPTELLQEANAVVRSLEEVDLSLLEQLCA
ncbi:MAG: HAD family phosphatase [Candidatus Binatia bacterium]|jgi:beta-phosphoglucomutase